MTQSKKLIAALEEGGYRVLPDPPPKGHPTRVVVQLPRHRSLEIVPEPQHLTRHIARATSGNVDLTCTPLDDHDSCATYHYRVKHTALIWLDNITDEDFE